MILTFFCLFLNIVFGQKVGLVLSGGGSRGFAHIGVIKALEENNIPIDYITGTSAGSLVGSFYVAGYSPEEMQKILLRESFKWLAPGSVLKEAQYFNRTEIDPSIIQIPLFYKSSRRFLPDNLVSDYEINIHLNKYLIKAGGKAKNNFDSLFVPFRCLASDVVSGKSIVFKSGSLAFAVRSSIAVPFFFAGASNEEYRSLYDGGIYDNFPVNTMNEEFKPDIIIGSYVNGYPDKKEDIEERESFIGTLIGNHLIDQKSYQKLSPKDILLMPELGRMKPTDFSLSGINKAINIGYETTIRCIDDIKASIGRIEDSLERSKRRQNFRSAMQPVQFSSLKIFGIDEGEEQYVQRLFNPENHQRNFDDLEKLYRRLKTDSHFANVFPELILDTTQATFPGMNPTYSARLFIRDASKFNIKFGGSFFTPTDHQILLGVRYQGISFFGYEFGLDLVQGSFMNSVKSKVRIDLPIPTPILFELQNTILQYELQNPVFNFFSEKKFADISSNVYEFKPQIIFPISIDQKIKLGYAYQSITDYYYKFPDYTKGTIRDKTTFLGWSGFMRYDRNTLDKKMYPKNGEKISVSLMVNHGNEFFYPGVQGNTYNSKSFHAWFQGRFHYECYYHPFFKYNSIQNRKITLGWNMDAATSGLGPYSNYKSNLLASPKYTPLVDSPILFNSKLYSKLFIGIGGVVRYHFTDKISLLFSGNFMQSFHESKEDLKGNLISEKLNFEFNNHLITASGGLVYETPIGPIGAFAHYYHNDVNPVRAVIHIGYLIFNNRLWD